MSNILYKVLGLELGGRGTFGVGARVWSSDDIVISMLDDGIRVWDVESSGGGERFYALSDPDVVEKIREDVLHRLETL